MRVLSYSAIFEVKKNKTIARHTNAAPSEGLRRLYKVMGVGLVPEMPYFGHYHGHVVVFAILYAVGVPY